MLLWWSSQQRHRFVCVVRAVLSILGSIVLLSEGSARAGMNRWTSVGPDPADTFDVNHIEIIPGRPPTILVAKARFSGRPGLYTSSDDGRTWQPRGDGLPAGHVFVLEIDPDDPARLFAGIFGGSRTPAFHISTDQGRTFLPSSTGLTDYVVNSIAVDPTMPSTLFVNTGSGVFKSIDSGSTWTHADTLGIHAGQQVLFDPNIPGKMFATFSPGILRSDDFGDTWYNAGLDEIFYTDVVRTVAIDPTDSSRVYLGTDVSGLFKSVDGGEEWARVLPPYPASLVAEIVIDPANPRRVYAAVAGTGVARSADYGETWEFINDGLAGVVVGNLALDPANPSVLYAGGSGGQVFRFQQVPVVCGDSVVAPGEACDLGEANGSAASCCDAACRFKTRGDSCAEDGLSCTRDMCDGAGTCSHHPDDAVCGPCEGCDAAQGCHPAPRIAPRCKVSTGITSFTLVDDANDLQDRITWKWPRGEETLASDFGQPDRSDSVTLCVYDESGSTVSLFFRGAVLPGTSCAAGGCWKALGLPPGSKGYRYRDRDGGFDGINAVDLKPGTAARSSVSVKGRGPRLSLPGESAGTTLPLPSPLALRVQLHGNDACWEAMYSSSDVLRNDARRLEVRWRH